MTAVHFPGYLTPKELQTLLNDIGSNPSKVVSDLLRYPDTQAVFYRQYGRDGKTQVDTTTNRRPITYEGKPAWEIIDPPPVMTLVASYELTLPNKNIPAPHQVAGFRVDIYQYGSGLYRQRDYTAHADGGVFGLWFDD